MKKALISMKSTQIFGRPYIRDNIKNSKRNYFRGQGPPMTSYIIDKSFQRSQLPPIAFTQEDLRVSTFSL